MVFNTAMSMLQNVEDAEDTAQDVFIQVHGSIKDFKEEAVVCKPHDFNSRFTSPNVNT